MRDIYTQVCTSEVIMLKITLLGLKMKRRSESAGEDWLVEDQLSRDEVLEDQLS